MKGHAKWEGVDYEEKFSLVVRSTSIRLILAIVSHLDFELFQIDVKISFLNGKLDKALYMDQPVGFEV